MKKNLLKCFYNIRRCMSMTAALLLYSIQLMAAPSDHGRWYSDDDSGPSSHSPGFYIFTFIIAAIIIFFIIASTIKDDKTSSKDKGCTIVFFLILLVIGFLCVASLCK